ncbi:MAG: TonB-dependent receptor [Pseudomonas sp.]|nr:TonB-dependent receptor [Pseudomonas sp.]
MLQATAAPQHTAFSASLRCALTILVCLPLSSALAGNGVFDLGSVIIRGDRVQQQAVGEQVISAKQMRTFNRETVGNAVNTLPGVNLSRNNRNEEMVYVRGFDSRQVPLFLDGIAQYVPYDGYVDFARFTTFDLAEIRVAKGAASLLYGPNIMGGAINLVTRKPTREWEGDTRLGFATAGERKVAANVGSKQGLWYFQAGFSYLDADSFALGRGFEDHKITPSDTGNRRQNAYRTDKKGSLKVGFTPNANDEYALGYSKQDGEKGNPVYTGKAKSGIRYWQWPYWDKESLYFISATELSGALTLKTRLYQDTYSNGLEAFSNSTYSQPLNNSSFPSMYDDKSYGAALELISRSIEDHELHLAVHYKDDRHAERNPNSPNKDYRDLTRSVAIEDLLDLSSDWRLRLGVSHEEREAREVYFWPSGTTRANNWLAELSHDLSDTVEAFTSLAHKTRLPTIKDRYSARLGTALPNPSLKPEVARHVELGLRGKPWADASGEAALFYSDIHDLIQNATVNNEACGGKTCNQAQNIGRARHRGVELSLQQALGQYWQLGGAYTYLDRDNLDDRNIPLTDSPAHKLFAHVSWLPSERWEVQVSVEAERGREISAVAAPSRYAQSSGFNTVGSKAVWKPRTDLALEAGVSNLGNKNYELSDGYPMPGRTWFTNASFNF